MQKLTPYPKNLIKILEINECGLGCECGWNITIGGTNKKALEEIKAIVKKYQKIKKG